MPLSRFSLTEPVIKPGTLLQALETVMPPELISQAIRESHSQQQRQRSLPTHVVVALVIAMSFWASDSIVDVFKNLITGLTHQWIRYCVRWKIPTSSSISEARQMFQAASEAGVSPMNLGFTGTLRVIRRAIPQFQQAAPGEKALFLSWLVAEILDQLIPKRQSRVNPRVVKKTRSKFPSPKPFHRGIGTQLQRLNLTVVLTA